ncbi:MAG: ABC transporter permease [Candidatus Stahlbacteria bacterium]|nr:ABC transporter permease [Candidatus Stahlbacteria bacterium]
MNALIIAKRVIKQLQGDRRFLGLSIIAPLIIIYFLKVLFDAFPSNPFSIPVTNYAIPFIAFIVHFLSFILCAILLVQERTRGTLERMLISGFNRTSIIGGYTLGYIGLATLQASVVLFESLWLFDLNFDKKTILILFIVIWLLAVVSVMIGIFISTFARHEGHVFPFIPLFVLPSLFLSGVIINVDALPGWAEFIGKCFPLHYAVNIIHEIIKKEYSLNKTYIDFAILSGYIFFLWILASLTMREEV